MPLDPRESDSNIATSQAASQGAPAGLAVNLFQSLTNFFATLIGLLQTRLELLTTELQEEIQRAAQLMVLAFIALVAAMMGLFMIGLTIIFFCWETHRELAAVLVTLVFFVIAAIAALTLVVKSRSNPSPLQSTLSELKKDADELRERL
jgi:uncharacterized membrane protein YqjE